MRVIRIGLGLALFLLGVMTLPHRYCAREASRWFEGDEALQAELGRGLERWVHRPLTTAAFHTGSASYDGEWLFGTYVMAGLGFGQSALEHDALKERHLRLMGECIDRLLSPEVRAFDRQRWHGDDPIDALDSAADGKADHTSYLGYMNLVLSLHRQLDPKSRFAALNDRITAHFERRYATTLMLETYPGERYPVDNAAAIGSIGLYALATHTDHSAVIRRWAALVKSRYLDAESGLLSQSVRADGEPSDQPRGSGTALGAYFLSFADPELSHTLYLAAARQHRTVLGFGAIREYAATAVAGHGDVDSGPIAFGFGVSASGFSLSGSRIHRDRAVFSSLYATTYLFGAPYTSDGARELVTGGPIGNAILFAMLTAQPQVQR